ncbi:MmgE/PrpD family protein [Methylovirgula sp. 4M-Z18]|uniref:MmgE/PrpD family protein n=1 Tax=Methylovirgula sp. 4M-Z18 TaxID=2293567 RepID=UPI001FE00E9F|nr:MmgE/PrpD family protein [Methylovirgula sp. 4M-Z18]
MAETFLHAFARKLTSVDFADVPATTVTKAKLHILDTFGAAIAGSTSPETRMVLDGFGLDASQGTSPIWGTPLSADARTAAFVNGVSAHAFELDDSGGCDHSGAVVLPAAIAALGTTQQAVHGCDFLTSVIIGYEAGRRVLEAAGGYEVHNGIGWHSTGTCGAFGAAAAVAALMKFDAEHMASALGLACSFAGGTWAFIHDSSAAKKLHAGRGAEGGIVAGNLAAKGFQGPSAIFERESWGSFFQTFCRGEADAEALSRDFGENWRIDRCSIKPYATCRGTHAAIDAVDLLLRQHALAHDAITSITVDMSRFQFGMCGSKAVASRAQAQMSLPYALAARLLYGKVSLAELEESAWRNPSIQPWLDRQTVRIDPAMSDEDEPVVSLLTEDGQHLTAGVEFPLGSPANPLSEQQIVDKYRDLAGIALQAEKIERLRDAVLTLECIEDTRTLLTMLQ